MCLFVPLGWPRWTGGPRPQPQPRPDHSRDRNYEPNPNTTRCIRVSAGLEEEINLFEDALPVALEKAKEKAESAVQV